MKQAIQLMNSLGKEKIPFLFLIDFDQQQPLVIPLNQVNPAEILFEINGISNFPPQQTINKKLGFSVFPVSEERYNKAFDLVQQNLRYGNSFLLNLTMPSRVESNFSLQEIFFVSKAKYKLWMRERFVVFSPEIFVQINGRQISSFPMKGTIEATLPGAELLLLRNEKELAEHFTIVDLIRNDLSIVAKQVRVERFRYIDHIRTNRNELLQMSSQVSGILPENFHETLGNIIFSMLPAGSVSGAPKKKTVEIIKQAEQYDRGFYTGIFGLFDGNNLDSGVMIRFIEQTAGGLVYKSGGGITTQSRCNEEYRELIDKIYVPLS